jgi:hypothetical protein
MASIATGALNSGLLGSGLGKLLCSRLCQRWVPWFGALLRFLANDETGQEDPDSLVWFLLGKVK